ncbi:dual specificity protein phosphatase family protein [Mycobacterium sp. AZCC_0083]|uniref:protein-tyrosine phosphatase family protein n=1 Tax=Mycobacterium sp. AZCC_0083 TaxID=2735882 RepID=UPI001610C6BD|nr:dual specificity protein phosphatase family protein [Mycobacterium sp. AZCC_0083]MBB5167137.1 protein-tyrosine phosphatase [Mycobacterium sp. AZCC_0083]
MALRTEDITLVVTDPTTTREWRASNGDHTAIDITTDPQTQRLSGVARHGWTPFDMPYISEIGHNLWQGGCETGLVLPKHIKHLVSLYPWERYTINHDVLSETYVQMYDAEDQGYEQVDALARWVNLCRESGPVLVHCQAGLNRSSLVAAKALYLEWQGQELPGADPIDGDFIVSLLRDKRSPAALCNPAFEAEVRSWA